MVVSGDVVAYTTWAEDSAAAKWRLVVADRHSGQVKHDARIGGVNALAIWVDADGAILVAEPHLTPDRNSTQGLRIHRYDPASASVTVAVELADADMVPIGLEVLDDSTIGLWGFHRGQDGINAMRVMVFDWRHNEIITDRVIDGLTLEADAPEEAYLGILVHSVVWDMARSRALVVHAHEDVVTTVAIPSGEMSVVELEESRSILEAFVDWLIPAAEAKGLPGSQRIVAKIGDTMYIASMVTSFDYVDDRLHWYRDPTGLLAIDLNTLEIVGKVTEPIGFVRASPDGQYLVAGGATESGYVDEYITTTHAERFDLLLIDPTTLESSVLPGATAESEYEVVLAANGGRVYVGRFGANRASVLDSSTLASERIELSGGWDWLLFQWGYRFLDYAPD